MCKAAGASLLFATVVSEAATTAGDRARCGYDSYMTSIAARAAAGRARFGGSGGSEGRARRALDTVPPGCTCAAGCSSGTCQPKEGCHASQTQIISAGTPFVTDCVEKSFADLIGRFTAYGTGEGATTSEYQLPCIDEISFASTDQFTFKGGDGWKNPCKYPDVTAAYKAALEQMGSAGVASRPYSPVQIKIRVNVIDATGLLPADRLDGFCSLGSRAKIAESGYEYAATPQGTWLNLTGAISCSCSSGFECTGSHCTGSLASGDAGYQGPGGYGTECTDCKCAPPAGGARDPALGDPLVGSGISEAYVAHMEAELNRREPLFGGSYKVTLNKVVPTQAQYDSFSSQMTSASKDDSTFVELMTFFGMKTSDGGATQVSEYIELYVIPQFSSDGMALRRDDKDFVGPAVLMAGQYVTSLVKSTSNTDPWLTAVIHEIGHTLGLDHTFTSYTLKLLEKPTCAVCTPVEGSAKTGDGISDTPATPEKDWPAGVDYTAEFEAKTASERMAILGQCRAPIADGTFCTKFPDDTKNNMKNFMSYWYGTPGAEDCVQEFTAEQLGRARCMLDRDFGFKHLPSLTPAIVISKVTVVGGSARLTWLAPISDFWCGRDTRPCTAKYRIERSPPASENFVEVGDVTAPAREYTDDSARPLSGPYRYRVLAVDTVGKIGDPYYVEVNLEATEGTTTTTSSTTNSQAVPDAAASVPYRTGLLATFIATFLTHMFFM